MKKLPIIAGLLYLLAATVVTACSAPRTRPAAEVVNMPTEALAEGRVLFDKYCNSCHPGGMAAVGPAIINKPLPKFAIRYQIRKGLGTMPAFGDILSDTEVRNVADYIGYLKKGRDGEVRR
ncbi:cbb3-type cytochrome c oxidase subunit III [Neolewinella xylanilytica]|uniref:Cbb3-type cytochrome c oxidase subunit III n=1 Tax=Neolewinella xylanilytica TaxID=1514080 RepID=A0A2S6I3I2_9BACT|nr:cytochrome c [Neolewinella xylanilytica]PPK85631.1 cbb3-type cytochrome c oxidase subunit III [Neolewinella xylanilytica]